MHDMHDERQMREVPPNHRRGWKNGNSIEVRRVEVLLGAFFVVVKGDSGRVVWITRVLENAYYRIFKN